MGRRPARLADRPVPAAVRGVERPLPRLRQDVLAGRRQPAGRTARPGTACASWPPGWPGRRTCSAPATAGRSLRSTTSPRTTASPSADAAAYDRKHNEDNGEQNRDGTDDNRSWNHGVEGPTDDPVIQGGRPQAVRNLLGTLLLSTGVPMLCAGDEIGRTQRGNNNAYCQDNEISWLRLGPAAVATGPARDHPPAAGAAPPLTRCCGPGSSSPAARTAATARPTWSGTPPTAAGWTRRPGTTPASGRSRCTSTAHEVDDASLLVVLHGGIGVDVTLPLPARSHVVRAALGQRRRTAPEANDPQGVSGSGRDACESPPAACGCTPRADPRRSGQALATRPSSALLASPACCGRTRTV